MRLKLHIYLGSFYLRKTNSNQAYTRTNLHSVLGKARNSIRQKKITFVAHYKGGKKTSEAKIVALCDTKH
jgi:hypothetical protein